MARITKNLAIEIKSDFVTRLRSIGTSRKEIEKLVLYLDVSMVNINEIDRLKI